MQCSSTAFYWQWNSLPNQRPPSQTLLLLYQLSWFNILNPLIPSQETTFFAQPYKALPQWLQSYQGHSHAAPSSGPTSSSSTLFPPRLQSLPLLRSWNPQSHPWGLESTSFKFLLIFLCWFSFHESHVPAVAWNSESFAESFRFTLPRSITEITMVTIISWGIFL